ncbi:hypothetical protein NDU88_001861 [Pleurodeles waltl]|uniref:Secreted protein n=1 Tax=Pleurodeles waltl TaxID=8319 RepID=A0AAV7MPN7_PLEWA|nr:hypothetical protein NDU88_001861 [Pleurodeles waltl]
MPFALQVAVLPVLAVASRPSPAVSDGCPLGLLLLAVVLLAAVHVAVLAAVQVVVLSPGAGGGPFLALAGGSGTLAGLTGDSLEPLTPAVAAETTVAMDWVGEVLGWVLATLARSEERGGGVENRSMLAR